jgi:hypothetical protein
MQFWASCIAWYSVLGSRSSQKTRSSIPPIASDCFPNTRMLAGGCDPWPQCPDHGHHGERGSGRLQADIHYADEAMYEAKRNGIDRFQLSTWSDTQE